MDRHIPKPRKLKPELLPQDHPLLGNKETVVVYALSLGRQCKKIDASLLSAERIRIIIEYLSNDDDREIGEDIDPNAEPEKSQGEEIEEVKMEDYSIPEESDIVSKSEVMTGDNFDLNSLIYVGAYLLTNSCANGVQVENVNLEPRVSVEVGLCKTNQVCINSKSDATLNTHNHICAVDERHTTRQSLMCIK